VSLISALRYRLRDMFTIDPHIHLYSRTTDDFHNPLAFHGQSGRFNPRLNLPLVHPSNYQR
jgi:hypothetical protein